MQGPRWARVATDVLALIGIASVVAAFWWNAVVVALFALVLLGLTVARVAGLPGALQAFSGTVLLLAAWAATLDWYRAVPLLDLLIHALANGVLAVTALVVATRTGALPPGMPRTGLVLVATAFGALLGVLWEVGEWVGHTLIDEAIGVGYDDTLGDLAAGTFGSLVGGYAWVRSEGGRSE